MNTTSETHLSHRMLFGEMAGGSATEGIGAIATIVLAIIGLAGVFADIVAPVAIIVIGAVILMEGMMVSMAIRRINTQTMATRRVELGGGMSAGVFAGIAGIVLGILALFRTAPSRTTEVLLAVAVLVYGAALLVSCGVASRLNWLLQNQTSTADTSTVSFTAGSGSMFIGLSAVVLGILAIIGLVPMTLILIGVLGLGASALFSSPGVSTIESTP